MPDKKHNQKLNIRPVITAIRAHAKAEFTAANRFRAILAAIHDSGLTRLFTERVNRLNAGERAALQTIQDTAAKAYEWPAERVAARWKAFKNRLKREIETPGRLAEIAREQRAKAKERAKSSGEAKTAKTGGEAKTAKTGGEAKTAKTGGEAKTAKSSGEAKTAKTGGEAKTAKTGDAAKPAPSIPLGRVQEAFRVLQDVESLLIGIIESIDDAHLANDLAGIKAKVTAAKHTLGVALKA